MKKWGPALLLLCVVWVGLYLFLSPAKVSGPASAETPVTAAPAMQKNAATVPVVAVAGNVSVPTTTTPPGRSGRAEEITAPMAAGENIPPVTVLENVRHAIRQYGAQFGGNPVGTNPEITAALNGGNPKQANFISPEAGMRINGNGELVDAWGTPFFFHQLSGSETEVRSAGPDKIMWTADDLVTR